MYLTKAVAQRCSVKKLFLDISQNSQGKTCARVSFFKKLQDEPCNFIKKETPARVFSCEFCEISKNNLHYRTHPVAASDLNSVSRTAQIKESVKKQFHVSEYLYNIGLKL